MKHKRFLSMVLSVFLFTSCTGGEPSSSSSTLPLDQRTNLTFSYPYDRTSNDPLVWEIYKSVDQYVEYVDPTTFLQVVNQPVDASTGDKSSFLGPRVKTDLDWRPVLEQRKAAAGEYLDLTPYLNADPAWRDSFRSGAFHQLTVEGKIYAVPASMSYNCLYYNTELFEQAGLEPSSIRTWTDFLAACETLKQAGITPLALSGKDAWCIALLTNYLVQRLGGLEAVNALAESADGATFEQECFFRAAELTKELFDKGYIQQTALEDTHDQAADLFCQEQAAMYCMGSWMLPRFYWESAPADGRIRVLPFPLMEEYPDTAGQWMAKSDNNLVVLSSSEHPGQAVAFLKYLTGDERQQAVAGAAAVPAVTIQSDDPNCPEEVGALIALVEQENAGVFPFFDSVLSNEIYTCYTAALQNVLSGEQTPQEAMRSVQAEYLANGTSAAMT